MWKLIFYNQKNFPVTLVFDTYKEAENKGISELLKSSTFKTFIINTL